VRVRGYVKVTGQWGGLRELSLGSCSIQPCEDEIGTGS
jgi:hypothetical protein